MSASCSASEMIDDSVIEKAKQRLLAWRRKNERIIERINDTRLNLAVTSQELDEELHAIRTMAKSLEDTTGIIKDRDNSKNIRKLKDKHYAPQRDLWKREIQAQYVRILVLDQRLVYHGHGAQAESIAFIRDMLRFIKDEKWNMYPEPKLFFFLSFYV